MLGGRENPQRKSLKPHPQVVQGLIWSQGTLLQIDLDTELLTEPKKEVPRPNQVLKRGPEDQPVVQVPQDPEPVSKHYRRDRSHDTHERLQGGGKAEAEGAKLPDLLSHTEPQIAARFRGNRDLKVSVLQVQRSHPIPRSERLEDQLLGLHVEVGDSNRTVETGDVYNRLPIPGDFGSDKEAAVIAWRRRSHLDGPLLA